MATEQIRNKQLILTFYDEVWNRGNINLVDVMVSPDFVDHPPTRFFQLPTHGQDAVRQAVQQFRHAMPDFSSQPLKITAERDRVAYLGQFTGTHSGNFFQHAASGNKVDLTWTAFYRIDDGKIVESWNAFDMVKFMQQLGAMPAQPGAGH